MTGFRHFQVALVVTCLAILSACSSGNSEREVERGVEALVQKWASSATEGRADDLLTVFADDPDFRWVEDGRVAYESYSALSDALTFATDGGLQSTIVVNGVDITAVSSDAAAVLVDVNVELSSPQYSIAFDGILTATAIRQGDEWVFLRGHLSQIKARGTQ